jgi:hypothetical protein
VAAKALVDKLDEVHASPAMQSVWVMNHIHGGRYDGPNYAEELKALRAALESDSATQALASAGETQDSIMLAVKTERAVIADYIEACREDRRVVQVFDVLAKHIREGKHYPDLPTAPDPGSALASAGELPASLARNYQQATAEERAMARGFVTLWESVGVQDAEDWLYTLRNRAELLASLDEDDCRDAVLAALTADELEAALAVPVLASSSVVTLSKWLRHDEVCPTRNNPKAVLACSCGLNDAVLATLSATHALASAGELPASLARQEQG